jgi:hypothetical protein
MRGGETVEGLWRDVMYFFSLKIIGLKLALRG